MTRPNAMELLVAARGALLDEILPILPDHLRYTCRMIASAMVIASREIEMGKCVLDADSDALSRLLEPKDLEGVTRQEALAVLCQRIRQGELDPVKTGRSPVWTALMAMTRARLAISNPKVIGDDC